MSACLALRATTRLSRGFAAEAISRRNGMKASSCGFVPFHGLTHTEAFAMRRLIASTYGPRQAQDTKAAFAAHEKALKGMAWLCRHGCGVI